MISGLSNLNMIRIMKRKIYIVITTCLVVFSFGISKAQKGIQDGSKYGHGQDSIDCLRNLSLYREYVRQNDYKTALPFWRKALNECPGSSKNIYIDGVKMFRFFIEKEKNPQIQSALIDTLMLIYETRIKYFDQLDYVRGNQGIDLLRYKRDNINEVQRAYGYLKESVTLADDQSPEAVVATFMSASMALFQNQKLTADALLSDFLVSVDILNSQIKNNPQDTTLSGLLDIITRNFVQIPGLDDKGMITSFESKFKEKPNDPKLLNMIVTVLEAKKLSDEPLWMNAAKNLFSQYPTAELAGKIALISLMKNDAKEASTYYNQAIQLETDKSQKAEYYYGLAGATDKLGNKPLARDYAQKAIDLKPNWGDPYILIAQLYASSRDLCQGISLPNAVYWVAVDMLVKAKQIDPSVEARANNLILNYSPHFPNKEEAFFLNVLEGNIYYVGCWINESTKARF
jgi:tetratricopeptide (TPR) repeat protein